MDRLRCQWAHSDAGASARVARTGRPYDVGATRSSRAPIRLWWRAVRAAIVPPRTPGNGAGEGGCHLAGRGEPPHRVLNVNPSQTPVNGPDGGAETPLATAGGSLSDAGWMTGGDPE